MNRYIDHPDMAGTTATSAVEIVSAAKDTLRGPTKVSPKLHLANQFGIFGLFAHRGDSAYV